MLTHFFQQLIDFIGNHPVEAIVIVFLVSAGEALFVIGLFVPSTVVLVGAGTMIGLGRLDFLPIYLSATLGAIAGDALSYWFGRHYRERVRAIWPFSRYTGLLDRGERYFAQHGGKSVFLGRFIPGVKAVVPGVAGIVGMNPARFAVINVVSAFVWSAAHLLPGMGVGRAVDATSASNPRLLEALLLLAVLLALAWYATRFAFQWLMPRLERLRERLLARTSGSDRPTVKIFTRLLANEDGILAPFVFAMIALGGAASFIALALNLFFDPEFARADQAISGYVQSLRTPALDKVMIAVTMLGDGKVLAVLALAMVAVIGWHRRWRLAGAVAAAFIGASLFVPVLKSIIQRARPTELYAGAESFSFPSGHATLSATIIGIAVLLGANGLSRRWRLVAFLGGIAVIVVIAFSRVYLAAHWPSDVLAGVSFGLMVVFVLAFLLHRRLSATLSTRLAVVAILVAFVSYGVHYATGYASAVRFYASEPHLAATSPSEWRADPQAVGSDRRGLLDGEYGEPMVLQTNLGMAEIRTQLEGSGWRASTAGALAGLLAEALPTTSCATDDPVVLPATNHGSPPVTTYWTKTDDGMTVILRFWATGHATVSAGKERPILTASLDGQVCSALVFGLSVVRDRELEANRVRSLADAVTSTLGAVRGATVSRHADLALISAPSGFER
jgi:membrane protein DedA with SNARE-associated domain/membrane-associated phospholipid phosphatase